MLATLKAKTIIHIRLKSYGIDKVVNASCLANCSLYHDAALV